MPRACKYYVNGGGGKRLFRRSERLGANDACGDTGDTKRHRNDIATRQAGRSSERIRNRPRGKSAMTPNQIQLVQTSFSQVVPIAATAADLFYGRLFEIAPQVRPTFPQDLTQQKKKLVAMLGTVVAGLSHLDTLLRTVRALGRQHAGYGVRPHHYP